jgi:hypothetical protein
MTFITTKKETKRLQLLYNDTCSGKGKGKASGNLSIKLELKYFFETKKLDLAHIIFRSRERNTYRYDARRTVVIE